MRAVIVSNGVVLSILDLDGKAIDQDGKAARGSATYTVNEPEGPKTVEYEAIISAPDGARIVASEEAGIGWTFSGGSFTPPPLTPGELTVLKSHLSASVDADAESERLKYITPGVGQAMTYAEKAAQAKAALATEDPQPADYPMLAAEIGISGATLADVAGIVASAHQQWIVIGAAIEGVRLRAKAEIGTATTSEEAQAVIAAIVWPSA